MRQWTNCLGRCCWSATEAKIKELLTPAENTISFRWFYSYDSSNLGNI